MIMSRAHQRFVSTPPALLAVLAAFVCCLAGCIDVTEINTPKVVDRVNVDSIVLSPQFLRGGDSLFATIGGEDLVFAFPEVYTVQDTSTGAWYLFVRASRSRLNDNDNYEILYLQLDAVSDTGTYRCNASPVREKQIDPAMAPRFGLQYDRRASGFPASFRTGNAASSGEIHVLRIDRVDGKMAGTFRFTGYSSENDSTIDVTRGGFLLRMKR